eukprot:GHVO01039065.1.p1 GENE.GHVO01039065.1~~GHVO01039065.1.p1  ORF type:complete len:383 (+),score=55.95 GHVO01039065.1:68-1216(+)
MQQNYAPNGNQSMQQNSVPTGYPPMQQNSVPKMKPSPVHDVQNSVPNDYLSMRSTSVPQMKPSPIYDGQLNRSHPPPSSLAVPAPSSIPKPYPFTDLSNGVQSAQPTARSQLPTYNTATQDHMKTAPASSQLSKSPSRGLVSVRAIRNPLFSYDEEPAIGGQSMNSQRFTALPTDQQVKRADPSQGLSAYTVGYRPPMYAAEYLMNGHAPQDDDDLRRPSNMTVPTIRESEAIAGARVPNHSSRHHGDRHHGGPRKWTEDIHPWDSASAQGQQIAPPPTKSRRHRYDSASGQGEQIAPPTKNRSSSQKRRSKSAKPRKSSVPAKPSSVNKKHIAKTKEVPKEMANPREIVTSHMAPIEYNWDTAEFYNALGKKKKTKRGCGA